MTTEKTEQRANASVGVEVLRGTTSPATPCVVLVGNPNVGKTTLFNRLTGENARIGNYPGITVERRTATLRLPKIGGGPSIVHLVDAPGAYSLSARSSDEQIAIEATLGLHDNPEPALVVVVVDAGQLIRNLYLAVQLIEARVPVVIALNMIDEVENNPPSVEGIAGLLGVPCVATSARVGTGVEQLRTAIAKVLASPADGKVEIDYGPELRREIDRVAEALPAPWRRNVERDRALALWALTSIDEDDELRDIDGGLRRRCLEVRRDAGDRDLDHEIVGARYAFLDRHVDRLYGRVDPHPPKHRASERLDRVLLHPVFGFAIFVAVMLVMFQSLFSWSDPVISLIERGVVAVQGQVVATMPHSVLRDLIAEGIIGGVGNVIVFLPQILLLFLFIGLLEDSGYMSRVAFLMDRVMKGFGLHGRAFVPMLSGLACAVPAILATRTMERQRDRLVTMMVVPLMTCSARLPVYTLIIAALFPPTQAFGLVPVQGLMLVGMYVFSMVSTVVAAGVIGRTVLPGKRVPLILELPPYRVPSLRVTLRMMWERASVFLREAGTVILVFTVLIWALLSFPKPPSDLTRTAADESGVSASVETNGGSSRAIEYSAAGRLGHAIEPAIAPLGFDWKIGVGIIGAFAAREVFVSTLGIVYDIGEADGNEAPLRDRIRNERQANGEPVYTPLVGVSLLVFFALACQCMSTLAVVKRESRSWKWPAFLFVYMTTLAWLASFVVYQGGHLLGFG